MTTTGESFFDCRSQPCDVEKQEKQEKQDETSKNIEKTRKKKQKKQDLSTLVH